MAEQTDAEVKAFLDSLIDRVSEWDRDLVEQAVYAFGWCKPIFSANDFRRLLPEMAHGHVGIVIRSMAGRRMILQALDENGYPITVKSTADSTHRKPIQCWELSDAGFHAARRVLRKQADAA